MASGRKASEKEGHPLPNTFRDIYNDDLPIWHKFISFVLNFRLPCTVLDAVKSAIAVPCIICIIQAPNVSIVKVNNLSNVYGGGFLVTLYLQKILMI